MQNIEHKMSKRKKSEQTQWSDVNLTSLSMKDLRILSQTRKLSNLPSKRAELEDLLTTKDVDIDYNDSMTVRQLQAELKLRGLDETTATKKVYLQRLRGEIAPPEKKRVKKVPKRKRRHKAWGAKIFVAMYQPPLDTAKDEDGMFFLHVFVTFFFLMCFKQAKVLGVFASEPHAYNALIEKLLEDLKKKDEKVFHEMEKERNEKPPSSELLQNISEKCLAVFGQESEPNGWVVTSKVA
ncbi:hypothetical protein RFI_14767 [Reticulomyxa filosa]|uniref:SAP domain-containing protein n=1 Tax=Reticulomyxa filosa TaxID=46433 RepID=X6NAU5_RETFI|nr:hypothetical protein RFI_14767 [Reticulomyxa filosa]|eukprot:ETO22432.1 hypothetical protein RFI_14767 [Reticulomyxa filosa]